MTYNLRPRRASLLSRGAAVSQVYCFRQKAVQRKRPGTHEQQQRHHWTNDCVTRQASSLLRGRVSPTAPVTSANQGASRTVQRTRSSPSDLDISPSEPVVKSTLEQRRCGRLKRSKQNPQSGPTRDKVSTQTGHPTLKCVPLLGVNGSTDRPCDSAHVPTKCASPYAKEGEDSSFNGPRRKSHFSPDIPFAAANWQTTSTCHTLLLSPTVGTHLTGECTYKAPLTCPSHQMQTSCSPQVDRNRQTDAAIGPPQFRVSGTAPQTPARSKGCMGTCAESVAQAACSSRNPNYSTTTSQHGGASKTAQLLALLSPSTVTTLSTARGRKRKRGHPGAGGASFKNRGLSPQSLPHRTRTTASTLPSPSDLASPPSILALPPPVTPSRRQDGAAVPPSAASLTSSTLHDGGKPPSTTPAVPAEDGLEFPQSKARRETSLKHALNQDLAPSNRDQSQLDVSSLKRVPPQPLASRGSAASRDTVGLSWSTAQIPSSPSAAPPGISSVDAHAAPLVRRGEAVHCNTTGSPSRCVEVTDDANCRPSRVRWHGERKCGQFQTRLQQEGGKQSKKNLSPLCRLSEKQSARLQARTPTVVQLSNRRNYSSPRTPCEERTQAACGRLGAHPRGGQSLSLSRSAQCPPCGSADEGCTAGHRDSSQWYTRLQGSVGLQISGIGHDHFSGKGDLLQALLPDSYRFPCTTNSRDTHSCPAAVHDSCPSPAEDSRTGEKTRLTALCCFQVPPGEGSVLRPLSNTSAGQFSRAAHVSSSLNRLGASVKSPLLRLLPPLTLCRILRLLPLSSLASFGATCSYARELLRLPSTWKHLDERGAGRWLRHFEKLAKQSLPYSPSHRKETDVGPRQRDTLQNICQRNTWDRAVAAAPFACVSRISVDLTCVRGYNQTRSGGHALFDLPAVALLRFAPTQTGRSGISHVTVAGEGYGIRRTPPGASAPAPAAGSLPQPRGGRPAAQSSRNAAAPQYSSLSLCSTSSAVSTVDRLPGTAVVAQVQSVSEEQCTSQQPLAGSTGSATQGCGTVHRQQRQTLSVQRVADRRAETQVGARMLQQAGCGSLVRTRDGEATGSPVLQQRNRLRRTLTVLLCNQMNVSHPNTGLVMEARGLAQHPLCSRGQLSGSLSPSGVESGLRHAHLLRPDEEGSSRIVGEQNAPAPPQGADALGSRSRRTGSHTTVEDALSLREIRRREFGVNPRESQLATLPRDLHAEMGASDDFCRNWGRQHHDSVREEQNHGATVLLSTQQWVASHQHRLREGFAIRTGQRLGARVESGLQNRPVSEEQPNAAHYRETNQPVLAVGNRECSPTEVPEGGAHTLQLLRGQQRSSLQRDRHQFVLLHQLLVRLQQPLHTSDGHQVLESAARIPRTLSRQASLSSTLSAAAGRTTDDEGCSQAVERSRLSGHTNSSATTQNGMTRGEHPDVQATGEAGGQENSNQARPCLAETTGHKVQGAHVAATNCGGPILENRPPNMGRRHNHIEPLVPRTTLPTPTDHQYAAGREQLYLTPPQVGLESSTPPSLQESSATVQDRRCMHEGALSSGQLPGNSVPLSRRITRGGAEDRPIVYAVVPSGTAGNAISRDSAAVTDDNRDVQRLRILRSFLVNMHQLAQINFKLQAREFSRLPHLREEVLVISNVLQHNAATLRLIKLSVDLTAVDGGAEELMGRNSDARNTGKASVKLPLLKLPQHLPALQVFHTDYPFQVPSGFSASSSFMQLCIRSLHRFCSPLFSVDTEPEQFTENRGDLRTICCPGGNELPESEDMTLLPCTQLTNVPSTECKARTQADPTKQKKYLVSNNQLHREMGNPGDVTSGMQCRKQDDEGTGDGAEPCTAHTRAHQCAAPSLSNVARFSGTSSRKRPREEHTSQDECIYRNEECHLLQLRPTDPPRSHSVCLPEAIKQTLEGGLPPDSQRCGHGSENANLDGKSELEEPFDVQAALRRRQLLRMSDLGLSPCHTLTPQSAAALSLQSSPASGTREELMGQLRQAFLPKIGNDAPENDAQASCEGEFHLSTRPQGPSPSGVRSSDATTAACKHFISPSPPCILREKLTSAHCSKKLGGIPGPATSGENSGGDPERSRHEASRMTPLAHLQRLLHLGRETLQQVDLQGDPPRTFCCLHSRLKLSKLRRLSLGWTCTAELGILHSMLLKGHLPQLRKLQFSGPSGGSGLSMMHLQLYALLNSPPSTCPHHPPLPLPEAVFLPPATSGDLATLSRFSPSSGTARAFDDGQCCERFCKTYFQTRTVTPSDGSTKRQGTNRNFPYVAEEAGTNIRGGKPKLRAEHCVPVVDDSCSRQRESAASSLDQAEVLNRQASLVDFQRGSQQCNEEKSTDAKAVRSTEDMCSLCGLKDTAEPPQNVGRTHDCQQTFGGLRFTLATSTAPQVAERVERGAPAKGDSLQVLASSLALAKRTATLGCKRCAAMRGGTAHGVYFKYAALDIDFAALIEFRLALQRHGLFAFYKDERNKLNLLHVEGLTDVASRDALEEEKSLENRLERKNEWKRRFAYHHIQSPPFSFTSSTQSDSHHGRSHSRSGAYAEDLVNAALWSVAPLPRNRGLFRRASSTISGSLLSPEVSSPSRTSTSLNHGTVSETGTCNRGTTLFHPCSSRERSTSELETPTGSEHSRGPTTAAGLEGANLACVATESARVGTSGPAAEVAEVARRTSSSSHVTLVSPSPSHRLDGLTPESGPHGVQGHHETSENHQENQVTPVETEAEVRAEPRLEPSQIQFSPRDQPYQRNETGDSQPCSETNPLALRSLSCEVPSSLALGNQGNPPFSQDTGAHNVEGRMRLHQKVAKEERARQPGSLQEQRPHTRRSSPTFSSCAGTVRSSYEARCHDMDSNGIRRPRRCGETATDFAPEEGNDPLSNDAEGTSVHCAVELAQGSARQQSGVCRTTMSTQTESAPRSEEATAPSSTRAAGEEASTPSLTRVPGALASPRSVERIGESAGSGIHIFHDMESEPPHRQCGSTAQSHSQSRRQQHSRHTSVALPNDTPLPHQGVKNSYQEAKAETGVDLVPRQDRIRKPYFPEVCPSMSGRDLFFLEMWLAPELCRDLQPASTLLQLSQQLKYLWEHKLTTEQRSVYNNVIVKRYVQEREAVQEWNFSTARAWWMGG